MPFCPTFNLAVGVGFLIMATNINFKIKYQSSTDKYLITFSWEEPTEHPEEVKKQVQQWFLNRQQLQLIVKNFQQALDEPNNLPQS